MAIFATFHDMGRGGGGGGGQYGHTTVPIFG